MGACASDTASVSSQDTRISRASFTTHRTLGQGGCGKVRVVQKKGSKQLYAMKEVAKCTVLKTNGLDMAFTSRDAWSVCENLWVVNLHYTFQDSRNLYYVMDFMPGGDLRFRLRKNTRFSEADTKFYAGCILLGLEYLHSINITHWDLKPENCMVDGLGYCRLTDFTSFEQEADVFKRITGTAGYLAPEVYDKRPQALVADFYSLGATLYELMFGKLPYADEKEQKAAKPVAFPSSVSCSEHFKDLIVKLLMKNPAERLGNGGVEEVKIHPWFADFSFESLEKRTAKVPFVPKEDENHFDVLHDIQDMFAIEPKSPRVSQVEDEHFKDFDFNRHTEAGKQEISRRSLTRASSLRGSLLGKSMERPPSLRSMVTMVDLAEGRPTNSLSVYLSKQVDVADIDDIANIADVPSPTNEFAKCQQEHDDTRV
eukprot:GILJ01000701.1.p1 GENE.GILJ01000701.1~~GILJ01000701.1.p1  ORF type:complete len:427 (-),score=46.83 GILJ01000701.1:403-1683(-)